MFTSGRNHCIETLVTVSFRLWTKSGEYDQNGGTGKEGNGDCFSALEAEQCVLFHCVFFDRVRAHTDAAGAGPANPRHTGSPGVDGS